MTIKDESKIISEWNQTKSDYHHELTLSRLFEEKVSSAPENIALIYKTQQITYKELNDKANQLAHYLRGLGVGNNSLVALCLEASPELIISILGILKAGGAYVPLDPTNPPERQRLILEETHALALISHSKFAHYFNENSTELILLDKDETRIIKYSKVNPEQVNDPASLAYIIFTSGSTGKPKGVMIKHRNVNHFVQWFGQALAISNDDVFDFSSSISFDFSVATTLFPIMKGAKIAICPEISKKDPYLYLQHLIDTKVTIIKITPGHFRQFKETILADKVVLPLKYIVLGGETLFMKDIRDWVENFPTHIMFCEYGPTEATVASSWIKVDHSNINNFQHIIPIGKPALNTQLYIFDKDVKPIAIGEIGELYIGGDGVAAGYLNRPEETKKAFVQNPLTPDSNSKLYKTGDLCRYLSDGNILFIGRVDFQVKIRGFRVEIGEIESWLRHHDEIKDVVVISQSHPADSPIENNLVAYYVSNNDIELNSPDLRQYLLKHVPNYMLPTYFIRVDHFPLSSNGKLDRSKLPAPESSGIEQDVTNHTAVELALTKIWSDILNLKNMNIENNFFDLGGNSLSAARIITKIKAKLKKEIKLQDFYNNPTIKSLAAFMNYANTVNDMQNRNVKIANFSTNAIPLNELQFLFWAMLIFIPNSKLHNIIRRKRLKGNINKNALVTALEEVCNKHEILRYYIKAYYPIQYLQNIRNNSVIETDIRGLSHQEQEKVLIKSLAELENAKWEKYAPLTKIKLYHLSDDVSEIQIAISHFVSDEISTEIYFNDLSDSYLYHTKAKINKIDAPIVQYKEYISKEVTTLKESINTNMDFWNAYLNNVDLFYFSTHHITKHIHKPSTTYLDIPESTLKDLQLFCGKNQLSISDSLCAVVAMVLVKNSEGKNKTIVINLVKSLRENDAYDKTIGLFLRSDIVKVDLNSPLDLLQSSRLVQSSIAETAPYQPCPSMVKLGSLLKKHRKTSLMTDFMVHAIAKALSIIFYKSKLNNKVLAMFGYVYLSWKKDAFLVDVNIMNNFITDKRKSELFGFKLIKLQPYQGDKVVSENVINIWFDRDEQDKAYLIISGNLIADFRMQIAKDIVDTISQASIT